VAVVLVVFKQAQSLLIPLLLLTLLLLVQAEQAEVMLLELSEVTVLL
jgi:hypothetical protein